MTRIIIIFLYIHVFTLVSTMGNNLRCTCHPPRRAPLITDHNAPVLVSAAWIIENDLQAVHLLRQLREKPTLYERFPISKMLQSYRLSPYTQVQAEGPYFILFHGPWPTGTKLLRGGDESALDLFQVIFHPYDPTFSPVVPTDD